MLIGVTGCELLPAVGTTSRLEWLPLLAVVIRACDIKSNKQYHDESANAIAALVHVV